MVLYKQECLSLAECIGEGQGRQNGSTVGLCCYMSRAPGLFCIYVEQMVHNTGVLKKRAKHLVS